MLESSLTIHWASRENVVALLPWLSFLVLALVSVSIFGGILFYGLPGLSLDMLLEPPMNSGVNGGISSILVGTFAILAITMAVALPLGVSVAVFVTDFTRSDTLISKTIIAGLDVMAAVPSIVYGLFGNALFCQFLGFGYSILSGGLTLACMVLPIFVRATIDALASIPMHYRQSGLAVGMSRVEVIWFVLIPVVSPAIVAAFLLALARAASETAALVFTAGYVDRMPESIFDSSRTVSVHIYDLSMNVPGGEDMAYTSALVLILLLLVINVFSKLFLKRVVRPSV